MQAIKLNDKRIHSNDTGEPFGLEKCAWVEANVGRVIGPERNELQLQDPEARWLNERNCTQITHT